MADKRLTRRCKTHSRDKNTGLHRVELTHYSNGSRKWRRTIAGAVQIDHLQTNRTSALQVGVWSFFYKDHLGSINAITGMDGKVKELLAFDPWGARRTVSRGASSSSSNQSSSASAAMGFGTLSNSVLTQAAAISNYGKVNPNSLTNRGFTGHEHVDEVGIIHMNGRIYDATIGRFLQADPIIQAPDLVGSHNRYSYVMNNPLNKVDPTGFSWLSKKWKELRSSAIFQVVAVAVISYFTAGLATTWALGAGFTSACSAVTLSLTGSMIVGGITGFVAGASGTLLAGGSVQDALKSGAMGALSGAAFGGIGNSFNRSSGFLKQGGAGHILAHGATGGVTSVLQGGKFGHGFFSAGFAKFAAVNWTSNISGTSMGAVLGRTTISALVGGTVSEATGGKFANGAQTAALAHLVNAESGNLLAGAKALYTKATAWHFEGRDTRNAKYESLTLKDVLDSPERWTEMSGVQASAHQDKIPGAERKFIHTSGAELVFSGKDGSLITDPAYKGTFNYINGVPWEQVDGAGSFVAFVFKGAGHMAVDYAPWMMGGNIRGEE